MRQGFVRSSLIVALVFTACTEPGEQTAVGSATGAALGAGLGAIVGSQTGSAGAGLVVGAVAGGAAGAMVGNALQAQDETMRTQDEAIERQEQFLRAQRAELDELRKTNDMPTALRSTLSEARGRYEPRSRPAAPLTRAPLSSRVSSAMRESDIVSMRAPRETRELSERRVPVKQSIQALSPERERAVRDEPRALLRESQVVAPKSEEFTTPECQQAAGEVRQAAAAAEHADRLFHYRRALRLCPEDASLHAGLADVYLRLNRKEDAQFEFQEALRLNPELRSARDGLARIQSESR